MNKNIVLVGLSGSGKTTLGNILSDLSGYSLIDTDAIIVKLQNRSINNIFATNGEEYFRQLETLVSKEVSQYASQIISTGGGIVLKEENLKNLKQNGLVFYLKTSINSLIKRLEGDTTRPLLKTDDVKKKLENMLEAREKLYEKADFTIETDNLSPEETAKEILRIYHERSNS